MALIRVLGLDPSLRNWGIAAGVYDTDTKDLKIKSLEVICALLPTGKQVRQNSLDLETAFQLHLGVKKYLDHAQAIFVEVPVGSQSARAMASYGICVGVLGAIRSNGNPFFEVTPNEVKLSTTGIKNATKDQMIEWAVNTHPYAPWPRKVVKGVSTVVKSSSEHMADAIAAIHAGLSSNQFQQLAAMKLS